MAKRIVLITSKGNGRNYLGYDEEMNVYEVVKKRGRFYKCKIVLGEGLIQQWEPLKWFKLVKD